MPSSPSEMFPKPVIPQTIGHAFPKTRVMDINEMIGFSHSLMQVAFANIPDNDGIHSRAAGLSHREAVELGSTAFA